MEEELEMAKVIVEWVLVIFLVVGGGNVAGKALIEVKKVCMERVYRGLSPLTPFTDKLTRGKVMKW